MKLTLLRSGLCLAATLTAGCVGDIGAVEPTDPDGIPAGGPGQRPGGPTTGGTGPGGTNPGGTNPGGTTVGPGGTTPSAAVTTGGNPVVRLLSRDELQNTLEDLFGATVTDTDLPYGNVAVTSLASPPSDFVGASDFEKLDRITQNIAQEFVTKLQAGSGKCADAGGATPACVGDVLGAQGRRLFRRPLTTAELDAYKALYTAEKARKGHDAGLALALQGMLQSPSFLYRTEIGESSGVPGLQRLTTWEYAAALSFLITRSTPDDALLDAAASGALRTADGVRAQVRRLLGTKRGREGVLDFYTRWLQFQRWEDVDKDAKLFPSFDDAFKSAARRELFEVIAREVLSGKGSFRNLLTTRTGFVDAKLAAVYGVKAPGTPGPVDLDPATRAGVFTQAAFLANTSKDNDTDVLHAGSLIFKQVLCQPFPPPPDNPFLVGFTPDPMKSRRENLENRTTASAACAACHRVLNPVAVTFDAYDPIGRHRTTAEGHPIDTRGELKTTRDADGTFANLPEMMVHLARSAQVSECHVQHWLKYALGRELTEADGTSIKRAHEAFAAGNYDVMTMVAELVLGDAFVYRKKI